MSRDARDAIVLIVGGLVLFVAFMGCVAGLNVVKCAALGDNTGHETRWVYFGGGEAQCLIQIDGEWIPTSNWRVLD